MGTKYIERQPLRLVRWPGGVLRGTGPARASAHFEALARGASEQKYTFKATEKPTNHEEYHPDKIAGRNQGQRHL